jgi:hypothetical protein
MNGRIVGSIKSEDEMGLLALLGLLAIVAIILGPVAFFSSRETREGVQELEKRVEARQISLRDALQVIERRLQQIETKLAIRANPAAGFVPASGQVLPGSLASAGAVRRAEGAAKQSLVREPDEADSLTPSFPSAADPAASQPASELTARLTERAAPTGSDADIVSAATGLVAVEPVPASTDLPPKTPAISLASQSREAKGPKANSSATKLSKALRAQKSQRKVRRRPALQPAAWKR